MTHRIYKYISYRFLGPIIYIYICSVMIEQVLRQLRVVFVELEQKERLMLPPATQAT